MSEDYQAIPALLHDARLQCLEFDDSLATLRLVFECLRRSPDGSPIDRSVEICLEGVHEIVGYYNPPKVEVRPSRFVVGEEISASDLKTWSRLPTEAYLSINSKHADFICETSCIQRRLVGDGGPQNSNLNIHLALADHSYSDDAVATSLRFACDSLQTTSNGVPLPIDDWRRQFEAWWEGWKSHWQDKDTDGANDSQAVHEDQFIPAGESDEPDLTYRPPTKEVLRLADSDAPADLLEPLRNFHEGVLARDWHKMALAYPDFDQSVEQRALELGELYLSHEYGRWVYLRQVDRWWAEGPRACVVTRGVEHTMPDEEDDSKDRETVLAYGLLKRNQQWVISTWSQGWPQYGSAEASDTSAEWMSQWDTE